MIESLVATVKKLERRLDDLVLPEVNQTLVPLFSAYNSVSDANVTGDGTNYTVICDTELVDIEGNYNNATGVFTAPITGKYLLIACVLYTSVGAAHTLGYLFISTSNRTYAYSTYNPYAIQYTGYSPVHVSTIADLDATDTANMTVRVVGGAKTVGVYGDATAVYTYFQGYLLAAV